MSLIAKPIFTQVTGTNNTAISVTQVTDALNSFTIILESIGGSFASQNYTIEVSDDSTNFTVLRQVNLGTSNTTNNSFDQNNQSVFGNPLHFRYVKITIPTLGSGIKGKITFSGR